MQDHGKADIADLPGHACPDPHPASRGALEPVNPAVVLLVQDVRRQGVESHAMRIVPILGMRIRKEIGATAGVGGRGFVRGTVFMVSWRGTEKTAIPEGKYGNTGLAGCYWMA
jgi:hypothetical protein